MSYVVIRLWMHAAGAAQHHACAELKDSNVQRYLQLLVHSPAHATPGAALAKDHLFILIIFI